jgi:hypothetical protein
MQNIYNKQFTYYSRSKQVKPSQSASNQYGQGLMADLPPFICEKLDSSVASMTDFATQLP